MQVDQPLQAAVFAEDGKIEYFALLQQVQGIGDAGSGADRGKLPARVIDDVIGKPYSPCQHPSNTQSGQAVLR